MDKIIIDGLEIFAHHGVLAEERVLGQKFIVSAEIDLDLRSAGVTDNLSKTINYEELCNGIKSINEIFDLIEAYAEKIASYILETYPRVKAAKVKVEKPSVPMKHHLRMVSIEILRKRAQIYLGLGSNMGIPEENLHAAIEKINAVGINVTARSSYYKTKPVSDIPQADYVNCVVEAQTILPRRDLIKTLLQIESELGRERKERWGPRTIDIDVLTYDREISDDKDIILPHPRAHERLFVLVPFCELNPYYVHPLLSKRMVDLKLELEKTQAI